MKYELYIAKRLKLEKSDERNTSPNLNIAITGIILAMVIMILSITIVCGFKNEITTKIYNLDSHIRVSNSGIIDNSSNDVSTVNSNNIIPILSQCNLGYIKDMSLIAEKPAIFKTDEDFNGIVYRGVDKNFNWEYINKHLVSGKVPNLADTANVGEVVISQYMADQLKLNVNDKIFTYFIDEAVKVRKSIIVGIYRTDFEEFDKSYILGNIKQLQSVNGWGPDTGNYVGINVSDVKNIGNDAYDIYSLLAQYTYRNNISMIYNVTNTVRTNMNFFSWLNLLDMNVVIILALMTFVSAFTLITGLLMIVLERINMIGLLKTMGATNGSIRRIFIFLTQKMIIKSIVWGNIIGIGLSLIQKYFHIIKLNPEAYYIPYVPIQINWLTLIVFNISVIVISYITLIGPSYIISSIKPNKSIRFE